MRKQYSTIPPFVLLLKGDPLYALTIRQVDYARIQRAVRNRQRLRNAEREHGARSDHESIAERFAPTEEVF